MKAIGVIPARYGSTRFPGKPLAEINGMPMIQHVYNQVKKSNELFDVVVATDHEMIKDVVQGFGGNVVMTSVHHETGSDRIEEVTSLVDGDFFVNIQGDEPLIQAELIDAIVREAKHSKNELVITAKTLIKDLEDIDNPNIVKVITTPEGKAIYFSRSKVPYNRSGIMHSYYKHLGIYGYPKSILKKFVNLQPSQLEKVEMLEQLRLLENKIDVQVIETTYDAVGVDTPEDIAKVEKVLGGLQNV